MSDRDSSDRTYNEDMFQHIVNVSWGSYRYFIAARFTIVSTMQGWLAEAADRFGISGAALTLVHEDAAYEGDDILRVWRVDEVVQWPDEISLSYTHFPPAPHNPPDENEDAEFLMDGSVSIEMWWSDPDAAWDDPAVGIGSIGRFWRFIYEHSGEWCRLTVVPPAPGMFTSMWGQVDLPPLDNYFETIFYP